MTGTEYINLKEGDLLVVTNTCSFLGTKGNIYEVLYRDSFVDQIYIKLKDISENKVNDLQVDDIKVIRPEQAFEYFEIYTEDIKRVKLTPKFKIGDSFWIMSYNKPISKTVTGIRIENYIEIIDREEFHCSCIEYSVNYNLKYEYNEEDMFKTKKELIESL